MEDPILVPNCQSGESDTITCSALFLSCFNFDKAKNGFLYDHKHHLPRSRYVGALRRSSDSLVDMRQLLKRIWEPATERRVIGELCDRVSMVSCLHAVAFGLLVKTFSCIHYTQRV